MDIDKLEVIAKDLDLKSRKITKAIADREIAIQSITDIKYLQKNAGAKIFTGRSGKIDEEILLREININAINGCVAVPDLLLKLAKAKLEDLEAILDTLEQPF